jgi:hypothetical protein
MDRKSLLLLAIILPFSVSAEVYKCADGHLPALLLGLS